MAAGTHMAATQQTADDQASSLYFSGICQTISVKCQHRNENGLLTCSRNLYVSCPHCHLLLCIDHIHEHENLLRYEIEQLINETNIVKANIRALLTTSQQQPTSTTAQVLDEKQRTLCELLERWATVGKISMSQAALIQHQCGYISQTTQQQAAAASTAAAAAAALAAGATNHHLAHHNLTAQQNGSGTTNPNKLPSHHQQHHTSTGHGNHHQTNSHHQDRSSQQLAVNAVKKRRSGKNKIVTLLMKNAEGEYECVNFAFFVNKMTETASAIFDIRDNQSKHVMLKIWSKTGAMFQDIFPVENTTFAYVKYLAKGFLLRNSNGHLSSYDHSMRDMRMNEMDNYILISIETRKIMDEQKTLGQECVKDGDEYLLTTKVPPQSLQAKQTFERSSINQDLIEYRTQALPLPTHSLSQSQRLAGRTEFRTDLSRVLFTLVEASHKLLWYCPDAEHIFKEAEEILSRSSRTESNHTEIHPNQVEKLVHMGFTEQQAQQALERTKYDLNAAMKLLSSQEDTDHDEKGSKNLNQTKSIYSRYGPFIPFRQFRKQCFQPNPSAIQSLKEMGFNHDDIINALRIYHNNESLACEYLIVDEEQKNIIGAINEQSLDLNSSMFQAIMENSIVQRALNKPRIFLVMLHLYEDPSTITTYLNDPEIGYMLLQISRIYNAERYPAYVFSSN
ncbi:unnamed protein product [Rotaria sp. Silwood2]|nr:unnamed protein product [Rotaria sp. Silwood2]